MGRHPGFDTTQVVQAARDVFWDKGYDGASVPDLEQATGLARSSLYHAFENKRGVFDAAVRDYLDTVVRPRLRVLTAEPGHPDAVLVYLRGLVEALGRRTEDAARRGCLLIDSTAGLAARDDAQRAVVDAYRAELVDAFRRGLSTRYPTLGSAEALRRARVLTSLSVTALVVARTSTAGAVETLEAALGQVAEWDGAAPRAD
ncbi:TetR/AcrR family transcriptional regulator [Cellulomonas timonensis]|uniref:TetR/AcrR family transcriptional regulator n=1 Tax=Cellulomonas timonensis TaxID=1689271 RepID=UPI000833CDB5|nr:TetR/AcrR family transcriptional regulator [Cellulomonas timonensis]